MQPIPLIIYGNIADFFWTESVNTIDSNVALRTDLGIQNYHAIDLQIEQKYNYTTTVYGLYNHFNTIHISNGNNDEVAKELSETICVP